MHFLSELRSRFQTALQPFTDDPEAYLGMIKPAQDPRFGDFQANFAMPLGKQQGMAPRDLAARILERVDLSDLCAEPEIAGPGFINLRIRDDRLEEETGGLVGDERLGVPPTPVPLNVVVDFSSPNVAKPMHVGHLRSTVIGDALRRMFAFLGHKVIADNHIGDWGTQFGMIIYGYKHFLDEAAFERDAVAELARLYRLVHQLSEYHAAVEDIPKRRERLMAMQAELQLLEDAADPKDKEAQKAARKLRSDIGELKQEIAARERQRDAVDSDPALKSRAEAHPDIAVQARQETAKLHAGDPENLRLWELFLPKCLAALVGVYERLDVTFDLALGESFYQPMLADVVDDLLTRGIAVESEGAICVFLEGSEAPFIVRKRDGAFTYATSDLATIKYRVEELEADLVLYVVDARQSDHFRLLFGAARRWGYDKTAFEHVSFGTILGPDKRPFKTRAGDTVGLESLLDEAVARARAIVDENDDAKPDGPELDQAARARIAEIVGIGGIKYADLRHNRESDYVFSWEKMLAKTGDTATYMQYSYARICGIFRKGGVDAAKLRQSTADIKLAQPEERRLALALNRFAEELEAAAREYRPNILTQYLFETANALTSFYESCPVLKERDESLRSSRLLLCDLTARVLKQGLSLLGILTAEQM